MILKWPLIGGMLLLLIVRWWARRSTPVRWTILAIGCLGLAAQAGAAAHQTWGNPADPAPLGSVLGDWVMLLLFGAVILWFQRNTRPDPARNAPPQPSAQSRTDAAPRPRRTGSTARRAGQALRTVLGEDRDR